MACSLVEDLVTVSTALQEPVVHEVLAASMSLAIPDWKEPSLEGSLPSGELEGEFRDKAKGWRSPRLIAEFGSPICSRQLFLHHPVCPPTSRGEEVP